MIAHLLRFIGYGVRLVEAVTGKRLLPDDEPSPDSVRGLPAKDAQRQLDAARNAGPPGRRREPPS